MNNPTVPIDKITEESRNVLTRYIKDKGMLREESIDRIILELTDVVRETGRTTLNKSDIKRILKKLRVCGRTRSVDTNMQHKAFKYLANRLEKQKKIMKFPPIPILKPTRRFLVFEAEEIALTNVPHVQKIAQDLLDLRPFTNNGASMKPLPDKRKRGPLTVEEREIEYLCSFLAAAVIFAKINFDGFQKSLLTMQRQDILLSNCFINVRAQGSNARQRFHLTFPVNIHFMRLARFYSENAKRFGLKNNNDPEDNLFNVGRIDTISTEFRKWTAKLLGEKCKKGLMMKEFQRAAKVVSYLNAPEGPNYPPFILAGQFGEDGIASHAYSSRHHEYFLGSKTDRIDYDDRLGIDEDVLRTTRIKYHNVVHDVVAKIAPIRRILNKEGKYYVKERFTIISRMKNVLKTSDLGPETPEYKNCLLYIEWIEDMILHSPLEYNSINTYASLVPKFLYLLIGVKSVDQLQREELIDFLSLAIYLSRRGDIRKALKHFCNFMGIKFGAPFNDINWKLKVLRKSKTKTMASFVSFDDVEKAISMASQFYSNYARSLKQADRREEYIEEAEHKARNFEQIIVLAYYCGCRVSEITSLRCFQVIGGQYLTIRKRIKTVNGKRNIYLKELLPKDTYKKFMEYVQERKENAGSGGFLFAKKNKMPWKSPHVSGEIGRLFSQLGFRFFRFHHLRHAYGNIFLLRWVDCFHHHLVPEKAEIFKHEMFSEEKRQQLKFLLFGHETAGPGRNEAQFALHALGRILGHGGPGVFLKEYYHIGDILFYLWSRGGVNESPILKVRQAMDFLQVSYDELQDLMRKDSVKEINSSMLYEYQKKIF